MYCKVCGAKTNDGDKFCLKCGNALVEETGSVSGKSSSSGIVAGIIALFTIIIPFISIPLAIVAIVKGKKNNNGGATVLGIVSLVLSILLVVVIFFILMFSVIFVSSNDKLINGAQDIIEKYSDKIDGFDDWGDVFDTNDDLSNHEWRANDGSILSLKSDGNYAWYNDSKMDENNYSYGKYSVYNGFEAVTYIASHFKELGFTFDKQMDYFEDDKYEIDDYYLLVLECENNISDGKEADKEDTYNYYGFYLDGSLKLIDIKTSENKNFILSDKKSEGTL